MLFRSIQLTSYPSYLLIVGLWGGPYLTHIYGYDLTGRGQILFVAALAQVLGSFFWGPSDRLFGSYKVPILIGSTTALVALLILCIGGVLPIPALIGVFVLVGFSGRINTWDSFHLERQSGKNQATNKVDAVYIQGYRPQSERSLQGLAESLQHRLFWHGDPQIQLCNT